MHWQRQRQQQVSPALGEGQTQTLPLGHNLRSTRPWRKEADEIRTLPPGPHLSLTPLRHRTDGFFGAVLERAA